MSAHLLCVPHCSLARYRFISSKTVFPYASVRTLVYELYEVVLLTGKDIEVQVQIGYSIDAAVPECFTVYMSTLAVE